LLAEGDRRTTWLAEMAREPVGMASLFEYRRMPRPDRHDSRWGYIGNMFVRKQFRNRGIGSALLGTLLATAEERDYVRLVLSPSPNAVRFFERAGFALPHPSAADHRLLVHPMRP
jgi:GNAT superfamily N-acetyltransferase